MAESPMPEVSPRIESFWRDIEARPYAYDLFNALRRIDAAYTERPRLGRAPRPSLEAVRVGQEPSVVFAPATLASARAPRADEPGRLRMLSFGLFGPNGPLPLSITEYVQERERHHGDPTGAAFADLFHHRFTLLFYRAWADAQGTASLDHPGDDRFSGYVAALQGYGLAAQRDRDSVPDHARWLNSGHLVRATRNAEGLARILEAFFAMPVSVHEYTGRWLPLADAQRTRLGAFGVEARLGVGAVAGRAVWDRQHRFGIRLGPMTRADYEAFLPGGACMPQLRDWVRTYIGIELAWDANLVLRADQVPRARLGGDERLGWTTWLGQRAPRHRAAEARASPPRADTPHADDLRVDVERLARRAQGLT